MSEQVKQLGAPGIGEFIDWVWALKEERDALHAEAEALRGELADLQQAMREPDELTADPCGDYESLRKQYLSLRTLANSALSRNRYLCRRDDRDMRAALSVNAANVSAERDTNAMLTALLEEAEAERDRLAERLAAIEGQKPVAWGAFHFGGSRSGKLYTHCETEQQIESYIADAHRSNDSITLRKGPLYAAPIAQPAPDVEALVEAAEAALGEIEGIMQEAYNSAYPVCCGRPGSECCGSPDPEWEEADQRMMDRLAPHQKALRDALAAHRKQGGGEA